MKKFLILNGPNLDMLGTREPEIYGHDTLENINREIAEYADNAGVFVDFFQANGEGELIDEIHTVLTEFDGAVINAGAYTHYSYAIHDAIKATAKPFIEVHLSNISAREEFRSKSVIASACVGQISGFGKYSYVLGLQALISAD